jgi:hypothetical protein
VFFDDSLATWRRTSSGLTTVLVGCEQPDPAADYSIASLKDLQAAFPQLWDRSPATDRSS